MGLLEVEFVRCDNGPLGSWVLVEMAVSIRVDIVTVWVNNHQDAFEIEYRAPLAGRELEEVRFRPGA